MIKDGLTDLSHGVQIPSLLGSERSTIEIREVGYCCSHGPLPKQRNPNETIQAGVKWE